MSEPVCAFQIAQLRKAITQKRKQLRVVGPKGKVQLQELLLGHKALPHVAQALDKDGIFETLSVPKLRRLWKQVADVYHKAVSKMSANQVIEYLYFTADQLNWDWTTVLQGRDTKKRVSKACANSAQPGDTTSAPASILRKARDPNAPKRALSTYQQYMKDVSTTHDERSCAVSRGSGAPAHTPEASGGWKRVEEANRVRWGLVRCERAAQYPQGAHGGTQTPGQTPLPGPPTAGTGAPTDMPRRSHLTSPLQRCKLHRLGGSACRFIFLIERAIILVHLQQATTVYNNTYYTCRFQHSG